MGLFIGYIKDILLIHLKGHSMLATELAPLDLRDITPPQRHAMVFSHFAALRPGQSMELINDHAPEPLQAQLELREPGLFNWIYLEQGPVLWRVQISKKTKPSSGCCGGCCGG